ncbi:fumarylacetoacetate hydrolase family protein [Streptomyces sp. NPDC057654]|uniref:fumarylacetoacetate hydrolase family protein n=1 Tax=Streptomyces sp. NPDC057654 TaxID=3346196 RepID=UPI0036BF83B3
MPHPLGSAPGKIVAVHLNYRGRAAERGRLPDRPSYFLKPPTSLAGSGDRLIRPQGCELMAFEGEIALVIGERARQAPLESAWSHVRWVTAANDVGVYDLRHADGGANLRSKGADGFTPLGPRLLDARALDPAGLRLRTWVNGEPAQDDTSDHLLFPFAQLIADLSRTITLEPGDVILTGTPGGAGVVVPGDLVAVEVTGDGQSTGRLANRVAEADGPLADVGAMPRLRPEDRAAAYGRTAGADAGGAYGRTAEADAGVAYGRTVGADPGAAYGRTVADARTAPYEHPPEGPIPIPIPIPIPLALTEPHRAALTQISVATLASQLRKRGYNGFFIDGARPTRPDLKLVGTARTLRYLPLREDLAPAYSGGMNAQKRAVESVRPGEVLVMDARREADAGTLGDILALRAQRRGAAGIVTDGGLRDSAAVAALDIPVYSSSVHPAVLGRRHIPWDTDVPIACGNALVRPGDVLVGDADGVLVLPPHLLPELIADAQEQELQEEFIAERVAEGAAIEGLYPLGSNWQAEYERWLRHGKRCPVDRPQEATQ